MRAGLDERRFPVALAAYRFDRPVVTVYRSALRFLLILILVVLVVTYVPALIIGVP